MLSHAAPCGILTAESKGVKGNPCNSDILLLRSHYEWRSTVTEGRHIEDSLINRKAVSCGFDIADPGS
jgi:hypothetical protein